VNFLILIQYILKIVGAYYLLTDSSSRFLLVRFGSIIVGAVKSKFSAKRTNREETKNSVKRKALRGSFSFQGGMQVMNLWITFSVVS